MGMNRLMGALEELQDNGVKTLEIYWLEDIKDGENYWWVDVNCDVLNSMCCFSWTWTMESREYFLENIIEETKTLTKTNIQETSDWIIVIDGKFSANLICNSVKKWLRDKKFDFDVKIIDSAGTDQEYYILEASKSDIL